MLRVWLTLVALCLLSGCLAGDPGITVECHPEQGKECPSGQVCRDFECIPLCASSADCGPAEACIENACATYAKSCGSHSECVEGFFCNNSACQKKMPLGGVCGTTGAGCASGHCVEGVCCDSACASGCMSCVKGEAGDGDDGTCAAVAAGEDPKDACGDAACDGTGSCFSKSLGESCGYDYECTSGHCPDGGCCEEACDGTCESCRTGNCVLFGNGEDPDDECPGASACDGSGACWHLELGESCESAYQCGSGACTDGVCCDEACSDTCRSCVVADQRGTCTTVASAPDADTCGLTATSGSCGSPPCTCDAGGSCKATSAQPCTSNEECASNVCRDNICCEDACEALCMSCNGELTQTEHGVCAAVLQGLDPNEGCGTTVCDGEGGCFAKTAGEACESAVECSDGFCVDGVCCTSACASLCEACDGSSTSGAAGTCAPIRNGSDPDGECSGPTACNGSRACWNRAPGESCSDSFECTSGDCCAGRCATGWQEMSVPPVAALYGIWGASDNDIYAVGTSGAILHFDGSGWTAQSSPTSSTLFDISGSSDSNIFAVGLGGVIAHFDGDAWSASIEGTGESLLAVHVVSSTRAYAAGSNGTLLEWDGSTWSALDSATEQDLYTVLYEGALYVGGGTRGSIGCTEGFVRKKTLRWESVLETTYCIRALSSNGTSLFAGAGSSCLRPQCLCSGALFSRDSQFGWSPIYEDRAVFGLSSAANRTVSAGPCRTTMIHSDGTHSVFVPAFLEDVWANDCSLYAVTAQGSIYRHY